MTSAANSTCWVLSSPSSENASMKTLLLPWKPGRKTSICGLSDLSWILVGFKDKMAAITSTLDMGDFILIQMAPLLPARGREGFYIRCSSGETTLSHTLAKFAVTEVLEDRLCCVSRDSTGMNDQVYNTDTMKLTNQPNILLVKLNLLL